MAKKRKKRILSAKQKAALAKGRAALKAIKRKARPYIKKAAKKVAEKLEPLIITEGSIMGRKRRRSRKAKKGLFGGFEGAKRRTHRRRRHTLRGEFGRRRRSRRRYSGGLLAGGKINPVEIATDIVGLGAGAVGASFIAKMVPVKDARLKAAIAIALGLGIGATKLGRNRIMKSLAGGAIAVGSLSLVKALAPQLPLLSGVEDAVSAAGAIDALPPEEKALLGMTVEGEIEGEYEGYDETSGIGDLGYSIAAPLDASNVG